MTPEYGEDDQTIDWDDSKAYLDDLYWSFVAFAAPFSWQLFCNWWAARRYIEPRDATRR